jgi:hypothetical protein
MFIFTGHTYDDKLLNDKNEYVSPTTEELVHPATYRKRASPKPLFVILVFGVIPDM